MGIVSKLVGLSQNPSSFWKKIGFTSLGIFIFCFLLPTIFIYVNRLWLGDWVGVVLMGSVRHWVGIGVGAVGVFFLAWTIASQWFSGKGTPAPFAPTQKLITSGPFKLCRNPIQFGAMFFYLGAGTYYESFSAGVLGFLFALIIGSIYHKFIEERELALRFGQDYAEYKKRVPFLIPLFRKKRG